MENSKNAKLYTIRDTINENIVILTHLTYAVNIFLDSITGVIVAIILFFATRDALSKNHFKFIIATIIIAFIAGILFSAVFGFSTLGAFMSADHTQFDNLPLVPFFGAFIGIILLSIWVFLRFIGGWIALFRKEPIQGHFGIRWRK